jgi:hypothetical protein
MKITISSNFVVLGVCNDCLWMGGLMDRHEKIGFVDIV